jgi:hypothetical protein
MEVEKSKSVRKTKKICSFTFAHSREKRKVDGESVEVTNV